VPDMTTLSRRRFTHCSLCAAVGAWIGACDEGGPGSEGDASTGARPDAAAAGCPDPFADTALVAAAMPWVDETRPLDVKRGRGLDGRLYTDLSRVVPEALLIDNDVFYLRTFDPDLIDRRDWTIEVAGLAAAPTRLTLEDLVPFVRDQGPQVLECSGNFRDAGFGLLSAATWAGAPVLEVLDALAPPAEGATRILVNGFDEHSEPSAGGFSTPGASWIFTREDLADAFFATEMNGAPLPADHGAPVRLYVPGWYGCTCIKWVDRVEYVDDDAPATGQMREFASRTEQSARHVLARDYLPAVIDQAAIPTRVEKRRRLDGSIVYRVVGLLWGGSSPTDALVFDDRRGARQAVDVCPPMTQNALWTVFQHPWTPSVAGTYELAYHVEDPAIRTRRLDRGFYVRRVLVDEV
jgi:DMSO/TMAO reductase YedYZ molybdopterin-dependent catalytic subunit